MIVSSIVDFTVSDCAASLPPNRRRWLATEDEFLRKNLGRLTYSGIGEHLGRSTYAVKIRQVRQLIPAMSKRPGWYTGNQVACILGVDIHNIMMLVHRAILP